MVEIFNQEENYSDDIETVIEGPIKKLKKNDSMPTTSSPQDTSHLLPISSRINSAAQPNGPQSKKIYLTISKKIQHRLAPFLPTNQQWQQPTPQTTAMKTRTKANTLPLLTTLTLSGPWHKTNTCPLLPNNYGNNSHKLWSNHGQIKQKKKKQS